MVFTKHVSFIESKMKSSQSVVVKPTGNQNKELVAKRNYRLSLSIGYQLEAIGGYQTEGKLPAGP